MLTSTGKVDPSFRRWILSITRNPDLCNSSLIFATDVCVTAGSISKTLSDRSSSRLYPSPSRLFRLHRESEAFPDRPLLWHRCFGPPGFGTASAPGSSARSCALRKAVLAGLTQQFFRAPLLGNVVGDAAHDRRGHAFGAQRVVVFPDAPLSRPRHHGQQAPSFARALDLLQVGIKLRRGTPEESSSRIGNLQEFFHAVTEQRARERDLPTAAGLARSWMHSRSWLCSTRS